MDDAFAQSARNNLREFKQLHKEEAHQEQKKKKRQPDSSRRRKEKKLRRKEKARGENVNEPKGEEETATGQGGGGSAASFSPGLTAAVLASTISHSQALKPPHMPEKGDNEWAEEAFLLTTGFLFDVMVIFGLVLGISLCSWLGRWAYIKVTGLTRIGKFTRSSGPPARKVGGTRKRVRFNLPRNKRAPTGKAPDIPFLGGPKAAARRHPPGRPLRLAKVQGRHEFDQEGFALLLSRYSQSTAASYQSQWGWWSLFCKRRGLDPVRFVPKYDREEEQLVIDYLVHCAVNEEKAPGTIKLRLSALRSMHLTLGYPDPLSHMPRVPLVLAGLRRRFGTKERRMPVTPEMLTWLGEHLQFGRSEEASLLWGALTLGFFFLLRASEYLDVGYQDPNRGLRGSDVTLKLNGKALGLNRIQEADEVTLLVRGSKTDIYNRGQMRNHFRTNERVCVVKAAIQLFQHFPQRYQGGSEAEEILFRSKDDRPVPRAAIQALIERAAKGLNLPSGDLGTHSLRFGGASALWAQYQDTALVKRWGRWASDSFQTYIWEARETARGVAQKMITADLTPS